MTVRGGSTVSVLMHSSFSKKNFVNLCAHTVHSKTRAPVVQSIVSLTSSLRGQLIKCFFTLKPKILKFFVEKMREAFHIFQQKIMAYFIY